MLQVCQVINVAPTAGLTERAAAHLDWLSRLDMRLSALPLPFLPFIPRLRWLLIGALLTG
jgi:hypothetical protein